MPKQFIRILFVTVFALFVMISSNFAVQNPETRHIGKWEGTDNTGKTAAIIFDKDGYASLNMDGEVLGGKRDTEPIVKYEFDYSKKPIWLDLILCDISGKEKARMKSIVKFMADDRMVWQTGDDFTKRPAAFDESDKENTVVLKRVSEIKTTVNKQLRTG